VKEKKNRRKKKKEKKERKKKTRAARQQIHFPAHVGDRDAKPKRAVNVFHNF